MLHILLHFLSCSSLFNSHPHSAHREVDVSSQARLWKLPARMPRGRMSLVEIPLFLSSPKCGLGSR